MRLSLLKVLTVMLFVTLVIPVQAQLDEGDARFSREIMVGEQPLKLSNTGMMRWFIFDVAAGALYLPVGTTYPQWTVQEPKQLTLAYFYDVSRQDILDAAWKGLRSNLSDRELIELRSRIARLHRHYKSITAGDRYDLTYRPGHGTTLALNGIPLVTIEGADFADAYFKIWLGEKALNQSFRDQLLS